MNEQKYFNATALLNGNEITPAFILRTAVDAGCNPKTVRKLFSGGQNVQIETLIKVMEATGAEYSEVFDPKLYKASRSAENN